LEIISWVYKIYSGRINAIVMRDNTYIVPNKDNETLGLKVISLITLNSRRYTIEKYFIGQNL
jgi:hypothetical protein